MVKKVFLMLLGAVLLGIVFPAAVFGEEVAVGFDDVSEDHWAHGAIGTAVAKGYVDGYPDGTFKPNQDVTRAEFVRMLADAMKLPSSQGGSPWYQPFVAVLMEYDVLLASDFDDYKAPISRLEIMRLVARGLDRETQYEGYMDAFSGLYNGDLPFIDYRDMADEDLPYIALAYGSGIMNGYPDASMGLHKTATRAEAVVMIENFLHAKTANPDRILRLQELREVAETGTNVTSISNLELLTEIDPEQIVVEHELFTASLKRLYVVPLKDDHTSIYERKFIWDRDLLWDHWLENFRGMVFGVLDLTPKRDFNLTPMAMPTYLTPGAGVIYQDAYKRYGYLQEHMKDQGDREIFKGITYEVVLGGHYSDTLHKAYGKHIRLQTNNAISGHGFYLLINPDAAPVE